MCKSKPGHVVNATNKFILWFWHAANHQRRGGKQKFEDIKIQQISPLMLTDGGTGGQICSPEYQNCRGASSLWASNKLTLAF